MIESSFSGRWLHLFVVYFQDFSPIIRLLLSHQSLVDGAACLFAMILLLQPPNWIPGLSILDELVCHAWDGQFIYWCSVHISGYEVVHSSHASK